MPTKSGVTIVKGCYNLILKRDPFSATLVQIYFANQFPIMIGWLVVGLRQIVCWWNLCLQGECPPWGSF